MQRLLDKLVWIVVVSGIAGAIYATSPSKEHPAASVSPHGIYIEVSEHDAAHCSRCNNIELRGAIAARTAHD
jgi:hypothetical protein